MAVRIDYELGAHLMSSFVLTVDEVATQVGTFGECADQLGDLVRAALMIVTDAPRAVVSFDGEPMEWRLIVDEGWKSSIQPKELRLRILTFEDRSDFRPDCEGEIALDVRCTAKDFGESVRRAAQAVWEEYGPNRYRSRVSGEEFPLKALRALSSTLLFPEQDEPRYS